MAVSSTITFKQTPARRPAEADVLNGVKANYPPGSSTAPDQPDAAEFNQMGALLAALGAITPLARISVEFSGGAPVIAYVVSVRDDIVSGDFTLVDNANGDTSITWPAGTFPAPTSQPIVGVNQATPLFTAAWNIASGVRVRTWADGSAGADGNFTVLIF